MTDKVYIVTSGEYSDYHIVAAFLDEAEADSYVARRNAAASYPDFDVSEWPVAERKPYEGNVWRGLWARQNNYESSVRVEEIWHEGDDPGGASMVKFEVDAEHAYGVVANVVVIGTCREQVEKALHDRVAEAKARLAGLTRHAVLTIIAKRATQAYGFQRSSRSKTGLAPPNLPRRPF